MPKPTKFDLMRQNRYAAELMGARRDASAARQRSYVLLCCNARFARAGRDILAKESIAADTLRRSQVLSL